MSAAAVFQELGPCVCECGVVGSKLVLPLESGEPQHVKGCKCKAHQGKRNQKKGKAANARAYRNMGGQGRTVDDDLFHCASLDVSYEVKTGGQIPRTFVAFAASETARHWWAQATKKTPVNSGALPALYLELTPSQWFLVVKGEGHTLGGLR